MRKDALVSVTMRSGRSLMSCATFCPSKDATSCPPTVNTSIPVCNHASGVSTRRRW